MFKLRETLSLSIARLRHKTPGKAVGQHEPAAPDSDEQYFGAILYHSSALSKMPEYDRKRSANFAETIEAAARFAMEHPLLDMRRTSEDGRETDWEEVASSHATRLGNTIIAAAIEMNASVSLSDKGRVCILRFVGADGYEKVLRLPPGTPSVLSDVLMRLICYDEEPPLTHGIVKIRFDGKDYDIPVSFVEINHRLTIEIERPPIGRDVIATEVSRV